MGTPYTDGFGILQGADALLFTPTNASLTSHSPLITFALERGIQALNVRFMYSAATILFNETVRGKIQFWYDGPVITSAATAYGMAYYYPADHRIWARTVTFNWDEEHNLAQEYDTSFSPVLRLNWTTVSFGFQTYAPQRIGIRIECDHTGAELSQNSRFQAQIQVSTVKAQ